MTIWFILLLIGSYLLGSLPLSYWAAKLSRGIDLRKYGTSQTGAGNLFRMTRSWKIGLLIVAFDVGKGMAMVWVAKSVGVDISQQVAVGLAVVIGHNWSVFLRFSGGRGIGTAMGLMLIFSLISGLPPWDLMVFLGIVVIGRFLLHSTPLPVLVGLATLPIVSLLLSEPLAVIYGYLALLAIVVLKRVVAQRPANTSISKAQLLLNRFLFDRDIRDRKAWMYRKPAQEEEKEGDLL